MLLGLGIIVGLPVLVFVIGYMLPKRIEFEGSARFAVPPEALWERFQDGERHPVSGAMCRGVERVEDGSAAWRENIGHSVVTVRNVEADEPRRLVRELTDSVVPMTARWQFDVLPDGEGSIVSVTNRTVLARGTWHVPIFRVMAHVFGAIRKGQEQYLRSLADGSEVTVDWR